MTTATQAGLIEAQASLEWYRDQMCEGFCEGFTPHICKAAMEENPTGGDCSGCRAVIALEALASATVLSNHSDLPSGEADRFRQWSNESIIGQLKMQARENLDPEYSAFISAAAERFEALSSTTTQAGLIEALDVVDGDWQWLCDQLEQYPVRVHPERTTSDRYLRESAAKIIRAALSSTTQSSEAGAVAWMYERNGVKVLHETRKPNYTTPAMGFTETPLYAHPPAQPTPAPSSVEGLREAVEHLLNVGEFCRTDETESALRRVRAALAQQSLQSDGEA
ncbi:MAG: hypothetical protein ABW169_00005 [Sphingobium sp.]